MTVNPVISQPKPGDPWLLTASGRRFNPLDPDPFDILIEDIAHALSMQCRFNGHVNRFYSVAEHSCLVAEYTQYHIISFKESRLLWRTALLHDAAEAYISDVPSPVKQILPDFKSLEGRVNAAIRFKFDLFRQTPNIIKQVDSRILNDERNALFDCETFAGEWGCIPAPLGVKIRGLPPADAEAWFLRLFNEYRSVETARSE